MWDEDPRWQEATYRCLRFVVAVFTVAVAVWSALTSEWMMIGYWLLGVGVVFSALCLYAAIVRLSYHVVTWTIGVLKRFLHRNHDA